MKIEIKKSKQNKGSSYCQNNIFGYTTTDHIFIMDYSDELGWYNLRVEPYTDISLDPRALVLHYGQSIFEGLKAYKQSDDNIYIFRPNKNIERMNNSAIRMAMPEIPCQIFEKALAELLKMDKEWLSISNVNSLYIRPIMFANEGILGVQRSKKYIFCIILCPTIPYFKIGDKPFKLLASTEYSRTTLGGCGDVKTSANYGQTILPLEKARSCGFDNILWLDSVNRKFIEEAGITNVFVRYKDKVVTPPLSGRILPGITRDSVISILKDKKIKILEEEININDLISDIENNNVLEIFVTGTATLVAPVSSIGFQGKIYTLKEDIVEGEKLSIYLYNYLTGIHNGSLNDKFGWMFKI